MDDLIRRAGIKNKAELAERLGIIPGTVSRWDHLPRYAEAYLESEIRYIELIARLKELTGNK